MCKYCNFDKPMNEKGFKRGEWLDSNMNEEIKLCLYEFDNTNYIDPEEDQPLKGYGIAYDIYWDYIDGPTIKEDGVYPLHIKYCPMCGRRIVYDKMDA